MNAHTAPAWANPDSKIQGRPGWWDVYCSCCGCWCAWVASAAAPASLLCVRCGRTRDLASGLLSAQPAPTTAL